MRERTPGRDGRAVAGPTSYWELTRRRIPEVRTLAPEIEGLVRELAPTVSRGVGDRLGEIDGIWGRAVGEEIAAHARPVRFRGGVLTVEVDSAPLAAELGTFAREHLREALAREGLEGLCELKFRTGAPPPVDPGPSPGERKRP